VVVDRDIELALPDQAQLVTPVIIGIHKACKKWIVINEDGLGHCDGCAKTWKPTFKVLLEPCDAKD